MNMTLKLFMIILHILFYPIIGLLVSLFITVSTALIFILYSIITFILVPFIPFFIICCLCGENGIIIAKVFFYFAISSLIVIVISPFILIGGIFISLSEFFKDYYFIAIQRINPNNKFRKNYLLLLSLTYGYINRVGTSLSRLKEKLIKKTNAQI